MKLYIIVILIALLITSCNSQHDVRTQKADYIIEVQDIFGKEVNQIRFDSIKFVTLSSEKIALLGNDLMVEVVNDNFYVLDLDHRKSILKFNQNGKFICQIGQFGKGPNEFLQPFDFIIQNDTIEILTKKGGLRSAVYRYSTDGKFINSQVYNYNAYSFTKASNGTYIFSTGSNSAFYKYRIYLSYANGKLINKLLPSNKNMDIPVIEDCLSSFGETIFFRESFNNMIYKLNNVALTPHVKLDFGAFSIPDDFFNMKIEEAFEMIRRNGFANIKSYHENKNYCLLEISVQKLNEDSNRILLILNKKDKTISKMSYGDEDFVFNQPLGLSENDEIIFLVYPIGDVDKNYKNHGYQVSEQNFNINDNPVLTFNRIQR